MAVRTLYRVQCIGPCQRYLSDVSHDDTTHWTTRASSALVFYDAQKAVQADLVALVNQFCPRCHEREMKKPCKGCGNPIGEGVHGPNQGYGGCV